MRETPVLGEPAPSELRVAEGPLVKQHLLTGELFAEKAVDLIAPNIGQWPIQVRQLVENGSQVEAGDVVVDFDNSALVSNLDQQRTAVITAETQLVSTTATAAAAVQQAEFEVLKQSSAAEKAQLEADIPADLKAEIEYQRLQLDSRRAELELREARANLKSQRQAAEADVELQQIVVRKARLEVERVESDLERLSLQAPRAGTVEIGRNRDEDRVIQAGDSVQPGMTVARIPDLTSLSVRGRLFDVDDSKIEPGLEAVVTLDAFPEERFQARVREVQQLAQQVSRRSRRRGFEVLLELESRDLTRMRPGMSVKIAVGWEGKDHDPAESLLLAPREALDLDHVDGPRAALYRGGFRAIEVGDCSATHCAILAGVENGDRLRRIVLGEEQAPAADGSSL